MWCSGTTRLHWQHCTPKWYYSSPKKHKPKHSHHREKKGHGPVQVLPQTRKLPPPIPPPPWAKVQALPLGSLHFAQGGGGMGGGIALPLAKVKKLVKTQKSKNCTEFALSADTKNECQKKSSGCQLPGRWFSTVSILGAVLYQYWSNTGANNVTEVYQ